MKNHHLALSQTVGKTNSFLVLFSSGRQQYQVAGPFYQKERHSSIFSISEPESALLGPESNFWAPCVKPFKNTRFWEVFWRPRTGNVDFWPKKSGIPPKNRDFTKKLQKCCFRDKAADLKKHYTFCFKKLSESITAVLGWPKTTKNGGIW